MIALLSDKAADAIERACCAWIWADDWRRFFPGEIVHFAAFSERDAVISMWFHWEPTKAEAWVAPRIARAHERAQAEAWEMVLMPCKGGGKKKGGRGR